LALVFFGVRYARPLYQSETMLILAYLVLFLPVALGSLRTALLQINPHLEEAARSLGTTPRGAFIRVTLPLLRHGLIASTALVFLVTMKELPVTLILGPTGFSTLATATWADASAALLSRSALSALLLVAASAVPMAALIYWERRDEW
jgi:iron(III) transport system permease protein